MSKIVTITALLGTISTILESLKGDKEIRSKRQKRRLLRKAWKIRRKLTKMFAEDGISVKEREMLKDYEAKIYEAAMDLL